MNGLRGCWDTFDVSDIFNRWRQQSLYSPSMSLHLAFRMPQNRTNLYDLYGFDEKYQPILVVYTHHPEELEKIGKNVELSLAEFSVDSNNERQTRLKRATDQNPPPRAANEAISDEKDENESLMCSLKKWFVSFADLGWADWIIMPQGIEANYCDGSCNQIHNMSNHAFIKKVFRERHGRYDLPAACCVPTRIHAMNILFSTNGSNTIKMMPEMKAEACGCL